MLVGLLAFLETGAFVGLVFPGETAVILGGALAGQGENSVWVMIAVVSFIAPRRGLGQLPARALASAGAS